MQNRVSKILSFCDRILSIVEAAALVIACIAILAMMLLLFADAALRYIANQPLTFTVDIVTLYLLSAAYFITLSYSLKERAHITVDLFSNMLPTRIYRLLIGFFLLCSAVVVSIITYETTLSSLEAWRMSEIMVSIVPLPMWLSKAIVAFGFMMLLVRLAHIGLANLLAGIFDDSNLAIRITHDLSSAEGDPL